MKAGTAPLKSTEGLNGPPAFWFEEENNQIFIVTKAYFERMMLAWESK
ncbi:MAG: hypothetical protein ABSD96_19665 [Candidatus Korobacteraceae bacterium]